MIHGRLVKTMAVVAQLQNDRAALERQVITVPGEFFDVNPGKRRARSSSRFRSYVRFSFGPAMDTLERALDRLEKLVLNATQGGLT